jgi:hypothetical protein
MIPNQFLYLNHIYIHITNEYQNALRNLLSKFPSFVSSMIQCAGIEVEGVYVLPTKTTCTATNLVKSVSIICVEDE